MPADNIKRAIEKATGGGDVEPYEEIVYEGYGPGGVAVLVEAATDNRNRTAAEVRSIFTKAGGQLAGSGAVAWQFESRGLITVVRVRRRSRRGRAGRDRRRGVDGGQRDLVRIGAFAYNRDQATRLELPGHCARARELAAGLHEDRAHLGGGSVAVVGRRLDITATPPGP